MPSNLIKVEPPDIAIPVDTILISVVSIMYGTFWPFVEVIKECSYISSSLTSKQDKTQVLTWILTLFTALQICLQTNETSYYYFVSTDKPSLKGKYMFFYYSIVKK